MRRLPWLLLAWASFFLSVPAAHASQDTFTPADTRQAIQDVSDYTGFSWVRLNRIVGCETAHTYDPYSVGDYGTSYGPVMLHEGGNALPIFYASGYDDPNNPWQAVSFLEESLTGQHPPLGAHTWNCK